MSRESTPREEYFDCHLRVPEVIGSAYDALLKRHHWTATGVYRVFIERVLANNRLLLEVMIGNAQGEPAAGAEPEEHPPVVAVAASPAAAAPGAAAPSPRNPRRPRGA